jgi:hypothetical protein
MNPPVIHNTGLEEVIISVGPDGRVYFHDLDPELIRVALAVSPDDALMRRRLAVCEAWRSRLAGTTDDPGGAPAPGGRGEESR